MTLIAVCSLKGSPGATTTSLALAARWPSSEQPLVVECDPGGGDLLARFRLETSPGLVSLAAAARHQTEPGLVWQHTQRMPGGLPVIPGPAGAGQARAALAQLTPSGGGVLHRAGDRTGTAVVADVGRLDPDMWGGAGAESGGAARILTTADVIVMVSRVGDDALSHLATALATEPWWLRRTCFVLVGDGYGTREVADTLGIEILGRLPHDVRGLGSADAFSPRRTGRKGSALLQAAAPLAAAVALRTFTQAQTPLGPQTGTGVAARPRMTSGRGTGRPGDH